MEEENIKHLLYSSILNAEQTQEAIDAHDMSAIKKMEKDVIIKTLVLYKGNQKRVAEELGIPPSTLSAKLTKYNVKLKSYKPNTPATPADS